MLWNKCFRFQDDAEVSKYTASKVDNLVKLTYKIDGTQFPDSSPRMSDADGSDRISKSLKSKVLSRVFSEDYERANKKILDPRGSLIHRWNKMFLIACLVSLFVDPLFFFIPGAKDDMCIEVGLGLEIFLTVVRSLADVFYIVQIYVRFQTAYVAPSSRVFGRGELVIDSKKIAAKYLAKDFWIDLVAALPLPQV